MGEHRSEFILAPCACAGCCTIVRVDRFWFDGDGEAFVEFYTRGDGGSWRYRLKQAWSVLRNTDQHSFDCVSLSVDDQERLGRFLVTAKSLDA